jgi:hypothetical protein
MSSHNFHICNELLTTSNYAKDNWIFFSFSLNFSNAGADQPWRKHMKPKASETKKNFKWTNLKQKKK